MVLWVCFNRMDAYVCGYMELCMLGYFQICMYVQAMYISIYGGGYSIHYTGD